MSLAPMTISGEFLTNMIKHPQYSLDEAFDLIRGVIPKITKQQVEAILRGEAKLTGTSPTMNYELDAPC